MEQRVTAVQQDPALICGPLLVDAHVHVYHAFERDRFFDGALANFQAAAAELGLRPELAGILMLTEDARHDYFRRFATEAVEGSHGRWTFQHTGEPDSLYACLEGRVALLLVAGRQIGTAERLEVLALGCDATFEDGRALQPTLQAVQESGAIAVLPWGFGKWWFRRGALISAAIGRLDCNHVVLGDNGGRPAVLPAPRHWRLARRRGIKILPGTDALPFASEGARAGSVGFVLEGTLDRERPAQGLKRLIREEAGQPRTYGRPEAFARFCRNQIRMQLRRYLANPPPRPPT